MIKKRDIKVKEGQIFAKTLSIDEEIEVEPEIVIAQAAFALSEAEFMKMKYGEPKIIQISYSIAMVGIGTSFNLIGKWWQANENQKTTAIEMWEILATVIPLAVALILIVIGVFLPNDKKRILKKIEGHFDSSPKTKSIRGK